MTRAKETAMARGDWNRLYKTRHGHCRGRLQSRTWRSWQAMIQRCYRTTDTALEFWSEADAQRQARGHGTPPSVTRMGR